MSDMKKATGIFVFSTDDKITSDFAKIIAEMAHAQGMPFEDFTHRLMGAAVLTYWGIGMDASDIGSIAAWMAGAHRLAGTPRVEGFEMKLNNIKNIEKEV